jgi:signal transduction histidine kinase
MPEEQKPHSGTTMLAIGLAAFAVATSAATIGLDIANLGHLPNLDAADPIAIVLPVGFAAVGGLIAARRPHNPVGWLFLAIAIFSGLEGVGDQYVRYALLTHPGSLPGAVWVLWAVGSSIPLLFPAGIVPITLLLLPGGHLPSRRWRPVAALAVILGAWLTLGTALAPGPLAGIASGSNYPLPPNPLGVAAFNFVNPAGSAAGQWGVIFWMLGAVLIVIAAVAPFSRMRRSRGDERQQLKWIAYAVLVTAVLLLPVSIFSGSLLPPWFFDAAIVLGFGVALPVASGVAILKHRLYDIDIVISRTLVYASLAVLITAVYVGIAVGIGALIGGGGKPNLGLSIVATAIVAIGFQPVRERVQRVSNRLVYGKRATPYEVLSQFSERVAESYAVEDIMPRMARVLAEGTGAQRADIWLRSGTVWREAAVWPDGAMHALPVPSSNGALPPMDGGRVVEVRHQGDLLGALGVTKRSGEALTPVEENLLTHLAGQAGLVLRNVGLTSDLQARLEELRASRQRLVTAQDQERRRLERNLHDGAQQHLVALKVKLGLAEMLIRRDPLKAKQTLEQLKSDADEALETLRDLARGIYPPLLADKGLRMALESQARKTTVPVTVEADGLGRYAQDVEAAVYFCVLEALQNIQKYARASHVIIRVTEAADIVSFEVDDNGRGFDTTSVARGSGLTNMEDRLDALGGALQVTSSPGHGTVVRGSLPSAAGVPAHTP